MTSSKKIKNSFLTKFIDEHILKKNNFDLELVENTDENETALQYTICQKDLRKNLQEYKSYVRRDRSINQTPY